MKDWPEVQQRIRAEVGAWFKRQCADPYTDYYVYYLPTKPEHNSGLLICSEKPANDEYVLASAEKMNKGATLEQNICRLQEVFRRLPVIDPR